jgi:hypothetical protein
LSDIWVSYREHVHDPFDWGAPVNLGAGVNSASVEGGPSYLENDGSGPPQLFFQSPRPTGIGDADIYVSELVPNGEFGLARLVPELSSTGLDNHPSVRFDGLEIFFFSTRFGGLGANDLWSAKRGTVFAPWSAPTNLGATVNSASGEAQPYLASDG